MQEIIQKRTLYSKTFDKGNGKFVCRAGLQPMHYEKNGQLIEYGLDKTNINRGDNLIDKAPYTLRISDTKPAYRYTRKDMISVELLNVPESKPAKKREGFVWNVGNDAECIIRPTHNGVSTHIVLKSENAAKTWTWKILGDKSLMKPIRGQDCTGQILELIEEWNGDELTIIWTGRCTTQAFLREALRRDDPDELWDDEVYYPVFIDPTVNEEIVDQKDDVYSNDLLTSAIFYYNSFYNKVGGYGTIMNPRRKENSGLRFQTIAVPHGAIIDSAILTVQSQGSGFKTNTKPVKIQIYGDDIDNAPAWSHPSNRPENINKTTNFLNFTTITPPGTAFSPQDLPWNVKDIVQEIIDRIGWSSNNNMRFTLFNNQEFDTGTGSTAFAFRFAPNNSFIGQNPAQLDIEYSLPATNPVRSFGVIIT